VTPGDKVLITGGTGFVGRHLRDALTARGVPYAAFSRQECDLTNETQADAMFAAHRDAGVVVHLACYQAAGEFPARHTAELFAVNTRIHANVLAAWRRHLPHARCFAIGASCGYPTSEELLTEERFLAGDIDGSVYAYAMTKRLLFVGLRAYRDQYGLQGTYLVPATMFGEHDDFHPETAHVCAALIEKFVRAVREGHAEVEIWGDGGQVRDFMDVEDFVQVLLDLLPRCDDEILNVGPGVGTPIRVLAETIGKAAGFTGRYGYNPRRYVGVRRKVMSARRLEETWGVKVPADLGPGIARTVAWYARHRAAGTPLPKFTEAGFR
jgi:GDP-L-fucose synthase